MEEEDAPAPAATAAPPALDENVDTHHHPQHQKQQQQQQQQTAQLPAEKPPPAPPIAARPAATPTPTPTPTPPAPLDNEPMSLSPGEPVTPAWARRLELVLDAATRAANPDSAGNPAANAHALPPTALRRALPARVLAELVDRAARLLQAEPTLVEVRPEPGEHVVVVGDTHGQFHDLRRLFATAGYPREAEEEGAAPAPPASSASALSPILIDPRALCADLRARRAASSDTPHDHPSSTPPTTPTPTRRTFVFNGDYVDRGAWGVELLALVLAWKLALPRSVVLLRGNHESATCTRVYGFFAELAAKYGAAGAPAVVAQGGGGGGGAAGGAVAAATTAAAAAAEAPVPLARRRQQQQQQAHQQPSQPPSPSHKKLYLSFRRLFATMPLAALIDGRTLVLHGGLFRAPATAAAAGKKKGGKNKAAAAKQQAQQQPPRSHAGPLRVGTLAQLRAAPKGGQDPDGFTAASRVSADVLWSDPVLSKGLRPNASRGVGCVFGPDVTAAFLRAEGLELILRSHEGPDARDRFSDDEEEEKEEEEEMEGEGEGEEEGRMEEEEGKRNGHGGDDEVEAEDAAAAGADPTRRDYGDGLRAELGPMLDGYSVDHVTPHGVLMTVFSAPDYPQFQPENDGDDEEQQGEGEAQGEREEGKAAAAAGNGDGDDGDAEMAPANAADPKAHPDGDDDGAAPLPSPPTAAKPKRPRGRYRNLASVALLTGPSWAAPAMLRFAADLPRPPAPPYYDFELCMAPSDEGEELAAALGPAVSSGGGEEEEEDDGRGASGGKQAAAATAAPAKRQRRGAAAGVAAAVAAEAAAAGGDGSDDSDFDPCAEEEGGKKRARSRGKKQGKASLPPPPCGRAPAKSKAAAAAGAVGSPPPHVPAAHVVEVAAKDDNDDGPVREEEEQQRAEDAEAVPPPAPPPPPPQVAAAE